MSKTLHISDDLKLPVDFVTQTQAILAKRGVGKSYTAAVQAEELLANDQQIVAIDPTGAWYGLKSSADGKHPGFPVVVFGGEHADVPLEETAGEIVAQSIVEHRFSAIIDLSLLRKGQTQRFMAPFAETLYRLNRTPLHLFVDEADAVAPQKPFGDEARTLGAMEDIVRRGRIRGIGCTLITQRPAVLNKNVLTQCELLTSLRLVHPRDIDAVMEWIHVHGEPEKAAAMTESLPSLPIGTAWMWCPAWDLFKRLRIRERKTFDSGATPKAGMKVKPPKVLAAVDVERLGEQIKSTVQRAKENDPRELKKQIADLKKQLAARPKETVEKIKEKIVEVPVLKNGQLDRTEKIAARMERHAERLKVDSDRFAQEAAELRRLIAPAAAPRTPVNVQAGGRLPTPHHGGVLAGVEAGRSARPLPRREPPATVGDLVINKTQQRILDALAWYESLGNSQPTLTQIGAVALIDPTGGHFSNVVGPLSTAGLVVRGNSAMSLTDAGRSVARVPESAGSLDEYHDVLRQRVRKMKSAGGKTIEILDTIIAAGGESLTAEQIGQAVNVDHTGGHFSNMIGPLGTAGLITRKAGLVTPTDVLFPPALAGGTR